MPFWSAEESGLIGSTHYVEDLLANNPDEFEKILLYLNFDMVASENYVRFVYDGDGSAFGISGPRGSAAIEEAFTEFWASEGLESDETPFNGRSDYQAFINNGIPAGGLFSGAEGIKTPEQEAVYGGVAGLAYDPCYHQACDTYFNVSDTALEQFSDAIAHVIYRFAHRPPRVADRLVPVGRNATFRGPSAVH